MVRWIRKRVFAAGAVVVILAAIAGGYAILSSDSTGDPSLLSSIRLVRPAFAQTPTSTFPDSDAGISAYIKFPAGTVDYDELIEYPFTEVTFVGDNYVIGTFLQNRQNGRWPPAPFVNVSMYADDDGWLVVYLPRELLTGEIHDDYPSVWTTILADALNQAAVESGASSVEIDEAIIGYYHWGFPLATDLVIATREYTGKLYFGLPDTAVLMDISIATACKVSTLGEPDPRVMLDGQLLSADAVCDGAGGRYATVPLLGSMPEAQKSDSQGDLIVKIPLPAFVPPAGLSLGTVHSINWASENTPGLFVVLTVLYEIPPLSP